MPASSPSIPAPKVATRDAASIRDSVSSRTCAAEERGILLARRVGPSAAATRSGSPRPQEHRERHAPDVARRCRVGRVEVAVGIEPGDGQPSPGPSRCAGRPSPRRGRCSRRRGSAGARLGACSASTRATEVPRARQELADRGAVLRARIGVRPEPGIDRDVAGVDPRRRRAARVVRRRRSRRPRGRAARPVPRSIPERWPPSAVGTPTIAIGPRMARHGAASMQPDAHRRLRPRALLRPLGVRGRAPAVRLGRPGLCRWPSCSPGRRRDARRCGTA